MRESFPAGEKPTNALVSVMLISPWPPPTPTPSQYNEFCRFWSWQSENGKYIPHFKYLYLTSYSCCSKACSVAFTLACGWGVGGSPNSDEGHTLWYSLYVRTLWHDAKVKIKYQVERLANVIYLKKKLPIFSMFPGS